MQPNETVSIADERAEESRVLRISGVLNADSAADLRGSLLGALESADDLELDLRGVSEIDLCGLQLLCSAHRTFRRAGREVTLTAASEAVWNAADAAGYDARNSVCSIRNGGHCLWRR